MSTRIHGIGAEFDSAADLLHAAEKIRDQGFRKWDVFTPFPVHGMDKAMGLGKSWLSAFVLIGGITGLLVAVALTCIPSFAIYPLITHGKPVDWRTLPAFFPIMFELTVLLSAFACIGALLIMTGLPRWHHPVFNWDRFAKVTDDGFFMVIEARDPKFQEARTRTVLQEVGGKNITLIED